MATTVTDRVTGTVGGSITNRLTGTPAGAAVDRISGFLRLSGSASDGDDVLLIDATGRLRLSGVFVSIASTTTDRIP